MAAFALLPSGYLFPPDIAINHPHIASYRPPLLLLDLGVSSLGMRLRS